jgi:beta propeller repeat protein
MDGQYITAYNLRTREQQRIVEIPDDYRFEEPSIYEDKVVWSSCYYSEEFRMSRQKDFDTLNWDVFLLDLETGEVRQITTDEHAQIRARIYGDTIVWLDNRHEEDEEYPHNYDVYAYDLETGRERRITTTTSITARDLAINGSLVVWTDDRNDSPSSRIDTYPPVGNEDIYLYDLSTNQERRITTDPASDSSPLIDNGRIVWKRTWKVRNLDIFLFDVKTGQETQISESGYAAQYYYPAIYGDRIVWADARLTRGNSDGDEFGVDLSAGVAESGSAEIYLYDLGTKREVLLVPSEGTEFTETLRQKEIKSTWWQVWLNPVIHGDFIVYTLSQDVDPTVYVMRLDDE